MAVLKINKVKRLVLECSYDEKELAKDAGRGIARFSKRDKGWTYPRDPNVVGALYDNFYNLRVTKDVQDYLDDLKQHQADIQEAVRDNSPLFEGDNLWDFQRGSVRFLETAKRCVLAHQMGTGKTVIVSTAVHYLNLERVLIVCPNPVKWSWSDHLTEWAGRDSYILESGKPNKTLSSDPRVLFGTARERAEQLHDVLVRKEPLILIINYEQLRLHQVIFDKYDFDAIVVDEAHRIKNRRAARTQALIKTAQRATYLWMLTGTPVRNDYTDLWTYLHLSDPERFTSYWNFISFYLHTVPGFFGGVDIIGLRDETNFNKMLSTYMFRKTKSEVMPQLPDKIYNDIKIPMLPAQQKAYEKMEKDFVFAVEKELKSGETIEQAVFAQNVVSQITRLRQICLAPAILESKAKSAKLEALWDIFEDVQQEGFILYSCFRGFLTLAAEVLDSMEIPYGYIVGGQPTEKSREVELGLNDGSLKGVLATVQMGEGLNLQAARTVVFADIDWVPAVNEQAEDRVHRGEITESPTIIRLYHPGTVDADVRAACRRKEKIVNETVGRVETVRNILTRHGRRF